MFGLPQNIVCSRGSLHQDSVSEKCCNTSKMCSLPDHFYDRSKFSLVLPGTKIPKWFNHQSVGSSISFSVSWEPLEFAFYVAWKVELKDIVPNRCETFLCSAYILFNGYKKRIYSEYFYLDSSSLLGFHYISNNPSNDIVLEDCNNVKLLFEVSNYDPKVTKITIERCGAHVACICPFRNPVVDKMACIRIHESLRVFLRRFAA